MNYLLLFSATGFVLSLAFCYWFCIKFGLLLLVCIKFGYWFVLSLATGFVLSLATGLY